MTPAGGSEPDARFRASHYTVKWPMMCLKRLFAPKFPTARRTPVACSWFIMLQPQSPLLRQRTCPSLRRKALAGPPAPSRASAPPWRRLRGGNGQWADVDDVKENEWGSNARWVCILMFILSSAGCGITYAHSSTSGLVRGPAKGLVN